MDLVFEGAEGSMREAVEKVCSLPGYEETGEVKTHVCVRMKYTSTCTCVIHFVTQWVIMDARHDSTANAYHTTVPCLSGR